MDKIIKALGLNKSGRNRMATGGAGTVLLLTMILDIEGVDPTIKFAVGALCLFLIVILREVAQIYNRDGTPEEQPYQPDK
jgi:hypothetical protein